MPPSSDPPGSAGKAGGGKPRSKGERKRGGQRGHRGAHRELVPEAQVNDLIELYPAEHEAGHAVVGIELGQYVVHITIGDGGEGHVNYQGSFALNPEWLMKQCLPRRGPIPRAS